LIGEYDEIELPPLNRSFGGVAGSPYEKAPPQIRNPEEFPPGMLLGPFIDLCEQRKGTANQLLNAADITELRDLLDYANKFHHDTNAAWETELINDQQLVHFCGRTFCASRLRSSPLLFCWSAWGSCKRHLFP
jgi:hypothetical protein